MQAGPELSGGLGREASQSTMKPTKRMGKHDRHGQNSSAKNKYMACLAQIESSNSADEDVSDGKI